MHWARENCGERDKPWAEGLIDGSRRFFAPPVTPWGKCLVCCGGLHYCSPIAVDLSAVLIPQPLAWAANLVFALVLLVAIRGAPWWHLRCSEDTHVLFGACVALLGVWSIRAGIYPGLELHLLGVTLLTLMFGWQFAVLGVSIVLLVVTGNTSNDWSSFGGNALLTVILPVGLSMACLRLSQRYLPGNFFVYVFVAAFCGAGVSMVGVGLASTAVWWLAGGHSWSWLIEHYASFALMLAFPEAFMTGALLTVFVVYRPQWVASFDDERYLRDG